MGGKDTILRKIKFFVKIDIVFENSNIGCRSSYFFFFLVGREFRVTVGGSGYCNLVLLTLGIVGC